MNGSFIVTAGANVFLRNSHVEGVGAIADGGDYYGINVTGVTTGTGIYVENTRFTGQPSSTKVHGITVNAGLVPAALTVQNSQFLYFNDEITTIAAPATVITGNSSTSTQGASSVSFTGTNGVTWAANQFDKPPTAQISSCGSGASVTGAFAGNIQIGTTTPTTSCTLALPFNRVGNTGACTFFVSANVILSGGPTGIPPVWVLASSADMHGAQIYFDCPGQQ